MNSGLLILVSFVYLGVAYGYYQRAEPGHALAFIGYALANLGFVWELWR